MEARLESSPDLRAALDEMRRTRALLRSQPRLRAPRNFTLTAQMVGLQRRQAPPLYPALRLTSALATFLFALSVAGQLLLGRLPAAAPLSASIPNQAPVAMEAQVEAAPLATEAPAVEAPAPEAAMQAPVPQPTQAAEMEMPPPVATAEGIGGGPTAEAAKMIPAAPYPTPEVMADQSMSSTFSLQAVEPSDVEAGEAASAPAAGAYPPPAALAQEAPPEADRQAAALRSASGGLLLPVQVLLAAIALGAGLGAYWLRRR
jgi:hypothetical protein